MTKIWRWSPTMSAWVYVRAVYPEEDTEALLAWYRKHIPDHAYRICKTKPSAPPRGKS